MKKTTVKKSRPVVKAPKKSTDPTREIAREVAQACHDQKGGDIVVLDLQKISSFAEYFIIASGTSDRQVRALGEHIEERLKKQGIRPIGVEGYEQGHWVLIDFGSVVAHLFLEEAREHYDLENFWKQAKRVRFTLK